MAELGSRKEWKNKDDVVDVVEIGLTPPNPSLN
jgi:hypothetical protein